MNDSQTRHVYENLHAASSFTRKAETIIDAALHRMEPLSEQEVAEITQNLDCASSHRGAAIDSLSHGTEFGKPVRVET